jgi:flagellar protein FliO/FliZ
MAEPTFAIGELVKLVFALGVTIGLFYALALFMKRLQVGTGKAGTLISVLAALPLGNKEKIWVLDIAGEKLVVGTSPGQMRCLHVLKEGTGQPQADLVTPQPATESNFAAVMKGVGGELLQSFRGGNKP